MASNQAWDFPPGFLICPVCAADLTETRCSQCNNEYFSLGEVPCIFPSGLAQKKLWQHQMAMMKSQGDDALGALTDVLKGYDVAPQTRKRLEISHAAMRESLQSVMGLLTDGGLNVERDERFAGADIDNPTEYYQHILRDWAWDDAGSTHFETHANDANIKRVLDVWQNPDPGQMLVLGAGAGRLSWDLHHQLEAELTVASDINPFLLASAQHLIKKREVLSLPELYTYPQVGHPYAKRWLMQPPEDKRNAHTSWFALGADVWNMPFKAGSFDTIVTSWLLDVVGGDAKELIAVVAYLLKPGGLWVNTGPLLYPAQLSINYKYSAEEILTFSEMVGLHIQQQKVDEVAHMVSPLNARYHHEQLISFCAQLGTPKASPTEPSQTEAWLTPPWLVMHHLAIPSIQFDCPMEHEFVAKTLSLVDGERSIYLIAQLMQSQVPEGVNAKDAVVAVFGQVLQHMADAGH